MDPFSSEEENRKDDHSFPPEVVDLGGVELQLYVCAQMEEDLATVNNHHVNVVSAQEISVAYPTNYREFPPPQGGGDVPRTGIFYHNAPCGPEALCK